MKNNGFFSIYALMWLNIVTIAAVFIIASAVSLKNAKQNMLLYDAQIASVYRTKERLSQMKQCMIDIEQNHSQEDTDTEFEINTDGEEVFKDADKENETEIELEFDKQAQEAACISKPETFTYHDIRISIEYDEESCMIHLNNKQLQLSYSILDESINDLVYISVK